MKPWEQKPGAHVGPRQQPGFYAGIGSRRTPPDVLRLMSKLAQKLGDLKWVLRSGAADGADTAFYTGHELSAAPRSTELYLPWRGFNGRDSGYSVYSELTEKIAKEHHPAWDACSSAAKKMHTRNVCQILGHNCYTPSSFVLCWTADGAVDQTTARTGGTGQAIRIAFAYGVPVYNLFRPDHRRTWEELLL